MEEKIQALLKLLDFAPTEIDVETDGKAIKVVLMPSAHRFWRRVPAKWMGVSVTLLLLQEGEHAA